MAHTRRGLLLCLLAMALCCLAMPASARSKQRQHRATITRTTKFETSIWKNIQYFQRAGGLSAAEAEELTNLLTSYPGGVGIPEAWLPEGTRAENWYRVKGASRAGVILNWVAPRGGTRVKALKGSLRTYFFKYDCGNYIRTPQSKPKPTPPPPTPAPTPAPPAEKHYRLSATTTEREVTNGAYKDEVKRGPTPTNTSHSIGGGFIAVLPECTHNPRHQRREDCTDYPPYGDQPYEPKP